MIRAPIPDDEAERLADVRALAILDTPPEERFDRIVELAARVFGVPIAYIALIDTDRQWFKAKCGLTTDETGRDISFCGHAILKDEPLVISDARADERFRDNPLVVGEPGIRFYAGYPLHGPRGYNVGTLCLADTAPRNLEPGELEQFRQFAALAEHELNMLELIEAQRELLDTKNRLVATQQRLSDELTQAAAYVRSLLPPRLEGAIGTDWQFVSSSQLGGDLFGYHWLDDSRLGIYLLDVCGHGVSAALLSISIFNDLRRQTLPATDFGDPVTVLDALNRAFPMDAHGQKFSTIWYGVYESPTRRLRYATAGHPPALLFEPQGDDPVRLGSPGLPIGVEAGALYDSGERILEPRSRLYVFSDGAYELVASGGRMLMLDGFADVLAGCAGDGDGTRTDCARRKIQALTGSAKFHDDFSLLEVRF